MTGGDAVRLMVNLKPVSHEELWLMVNLKPVSHDDPAVALAGWKHKTAQLELGATENDFSNK